jgi:cytochrome c-type biogenesis protein CcmF
MIGRILILVAFGAMLVSTFGYVYAFLNKGDRGVLRIARIGYHIAAISVILTAGFLMNMLLTHQFQYTYVWNYSSLDLPSALLVSTFYVGQEGSFMLWTMYTCIIGLVLMVYSRKHHYESSVMGVYSAIASFLILLAVVKNPFEFVWQTWPQTAQPGITPQDGRGLNPLLQNLWIVIHPPILFLGFASTAVPFAHALSGLLRKDYKNWTNAAVPWTLFTSAILGFGITLGGFWAYETLGWGGFWGWDPVENSSFIPWLVTVASVHTLLVQRRTGGFLRANFIMGMLPFLLVLYSTFLTRSGVLGDTSVHSFETPGMWVYILLVALITFFLFLGLGLYFWRVKEIPKQRIRYSLTSREFALFLGAASLVIVAGFTLIGTSAPLITNIVKGQASAIDASYYLKTNLPLAIVMATMIGLGQLFWWKKSNSQSLLKTLQLPSAEATLLTAIVIVAGMHDVMMVLFFLASAFAFFVNLNIAYKIAKGTPKFMGASVAHIGVSLLFIGIIASAHYDKHITLNLPLNEPRDAFGYRLTYVGTSQIDDEKTAYNVTVANGASVFNAPLVMYASAYNGGAIMRHPYIFSLVNYDVFSHPSLLAFIGKNMLTRDLYLSPQALEQSNSSGIDASQYGIEVALNLNEPVKIGKYIVEFKGFMVPDDQRQSMIDGKAFELASTIELRTRDGKSETVKPSNRIVPGGQNEFNTVKSSSGDEFTVTDVHVDDKTKQASIMVGYMPARNSSDIFLLSQAQQSALNQKQVLVIEATIKPFINLVWGGVIIMVIGFIVTWRRRREDLVRNTP